MNTTRLRPGDRIRRKSSPAGSALVWKVLRLEPRQHDCPALVFMTLDIAFDGERSDSEVHASTAEVARYFEQVPA